MKARPRTEPTPNRATVSHTAALVAHENEQRLAARVVASRATGVDDCYELLGMLGLAEVAGLPAGDPPMRR